jgi:predicted nucleic acid-binding protein
VSAAFVLDASLAMTWLFGDEATPQSAALLARLESEAAIVPAWFFIEITNVIAIAERKGRLTQGQSTKFIADFGQLDIEVDVRPPERAFVDLLPLCRDHRLTSYDAVYLDLALRQALPLATLDEALRKAARKLDLEVLGH